ncbi:MAG: cobaltochelatase subunit CobN, partial [Chitinispirillaceae bacterium]|nr:cobaltochelatase subunit CobN [Chitinispirillaceae bacterium]
MKNWVLAQQYYSEGDTQNIKNLLLLLLKEYGNIKEIKKIAPPKIFNYALYLPEKGFFNNIDTYKKYLSYNQAKPTIVSLLYG